MKKKPFLLRCDAKEAIKTPLSLSKLVRLGMTHRISSCFSALYNKKFSQLEERERRLASREDADTQKPPDVEKSQDFDSDAEQPDEFDADLDADYTMDHYASEDDVDDDGGEQYE